MIQFDDIDDRLEKLRKNRIWLAEQTPYSAAYIRDVMAPKSTRRTERVQKILSDAIEREEARLAQIASMPTPQSIPDRISIECSPQEREMWADAANANKDMMMARRVTMRCLQIF